VANFERVVIEFENINVTSLLVGVVVDWKCNLPVAFATWTRLGYRKK
jgi:hypothetical protein